MTARRDPLASLARLRRLETGAARRRLAEEADRLRAAEGRAEVADAALRTEQGAGAAADYAAWLGRGMAERDRACIALQITERRMAEARNDLAGARAAERALEVVVETRRLIEHQQSKRRIQTMLDQIGSDLHRRTCK